VNKKSKILIAGGSGLIGQAFVRQFQKKGYSSVHSPTRRELDLLHADSVRDYFEHHNIEIVILAAGKVGGILENKNNPFDFLNINLPIQLNVCRAAHHSNCKRVVLLGSSCMYPKHCEQPMKVDDLFTGKMEQTSISYAISKMAGLQLGFSYNQQFNSDKFLGIIPNSAYGPGDNFNPTSGHVLSALIHRFHQAKIDGLNEVVLWGSGSPRREFLYSDDIANAMIFLLEQDISTQELPINIGSGVDHSINELAETIKNEIGFEGNISWDRSKPDGSPRKLLDSGFIQTLGWQPKISLREGIKLTYQWYKNKRS
jgi:GDP-L-fucose synthase